ncbi:hypothetical protein B0J18DRAFT_48651 [Chaetomium sp. MPI-SDFR-AT-0129]|nr:hypothetical protein B0J18DRAFT_48651 [Chaetomium sp. MPI-SDFR-AT-0129]
MPIFLIYVAQNPQVWAPEMGPLRPLPEPQFLDRPPPHSTLERGPFSSDAMRRHCSTLTRARLTRSATISNGIENGDVIAPWLPTLRAMPTYFCRRRKEWIKHTLGWHKRSVGLIIPQFQWSVVGQRKRLAFNLPRLDSLSFVLGAKRYADVARNRGQKSQNAPPRQLWQCSEQRLSLINWPFLAFRRRLEGSSRRKVTTIRGPSWNR